LDFLGWIFNAAGALNKLYADLIVTVIKVLSIVSVPSTKELSANFFSVSLGGTFGLATKIIGLMAVVLGLLILLTPLRDHSMKLSRFIVSLVAIALFGYLFYPIYGLMYDLSQGLTQGVLNLITGSQNGSVEKLNTLFAMIDPGNSLGLLISVTLGSLFAYITIAEAVGMKVVLVIVLILYPFFLAIRPLNRVTRTLFDACNSAIVVVLFSPPLMALCFAAPILVKNLIPGAGDGYVSIILTLICGILAAVAPIVLAVFVFKKSGEVFGSVDSKIAGAVDVDSMPPLSRDDMQNDIDSYQGDHRFKDSVMDVAGDNMQNYGNLIGDVKETAVNIGATLVSAYASPAAGMAVKAAGGALLKTQSAAATQGAEGVDSSTPQAPPIIPPLPPSGA
jgi:hypothetical protein